MRRSERLGIAIALRFGEIHESKIQLALKSFLGLLLLVAVGYFSLKASPGLGAGLSDSSTMTGANVGLWVFAAILSVVLTARFFHMRVSKYVEMPFTSFVMRVSAFVLIAELITADSGSYFAKIREIWLQLVPFDSSETPAIACLFGLVLWIPLNLLYPFAAAAAHIHSSSETSSLERLFFRASNSQQLVLLTLKDFKVYVGHIRYLPPNATKSDEYIQILPWVSGYRDKDTHRLNLTTFYTDVYDRVLSGIAKGDEEQLEKFIKVIPVAAVISANVFDPAIYSTFEDLSKRGTPVREERPLTEEDLPPALR